jgi:N-acetyl-anhydromuramyl-L-alanine amidase AmpD
MTKLLRDLGIAAIAGLGIAYAITRAPKNPVKQPSSIQEILTENPTPQVQEPVGNFTPTRIHQAHDYRAGRTTNVDEIVLHTTEGTPLGAETWLTSASGLEVSAHYLVWPNGDIVQMVNPSDTAWHVRGHNARSVGIEIAGYFNRPITNQQVTRTAELVSHLLNQYDLQPTAIRAHSQLDPSRRRDPGTENFNRVITAVNQDRNR